MMFYLIAKGEYWQVCLSKDGTKGVPEHLAREGWHLLSIDLDQEKAMKLFFDDSITWPRRINDALDSTR